MRDCWIMGPKKQVKTVKRKKGPRLTSSPASVAGPSARSMVDVMYMEAKLKRVEFVNAEDDITANWMSQVLQDSLSEWRRHLPVESANSDFTIHVVPATARKFSDLVGGVGVVLVELDSQQLGIVDHVYMEKGKVLETQENFEARMDALISNHLRAVEDQQKRHQREFAEQEKKHKLEQHKLEHLEDMKKYSRDGVDRLEQAMKNLEVVQSKKDSDMKGQLEAMKGQLAFTSGQLAFTNGQLAFTNGRVVELEDQVAYLIDASALGNTVKKRFLLNRAREAISEMVGKPKEEGMTWTAYFYAFTPADWEVAKICDLDYQEHLREAGYPLNQAVHYVEEAQVAKIFQGMDTGQERENWERNFEIVYGKKVNKISCLIQT